MEANERETRLLKKNSAAAIHEYIEKKRSSASWMFLDHSNLWKAGLSWSIFLVLAIGVPLISHFVFSCSSCDHQHRRPYDAIVQLSLSMLATLSFISLSSFARKYGLRRFLFLDKLCDASEKVLQGYTNQIRISWKILSAFVLPCFVADSVYKIWWFSSGGKQIPYFYNVYLSHTIACLLLMSSWLYRSSIFFLACVLFRLICSLQILGFDDFVQVFKKETETDVGTILIQHLRIMRNLRIISHRFRVFILSTLILVTASQFVSLLVTTETGAIINISTAGELALWSITVVTGLFICLRRAAKITHKAQSVTCLATKWHVCSTINSFDDLEDVAPNAPISSSLAAGHPINAKWDTDTDTEEGDDELDNTHMIPIHAHSISYQKRQALVKYFEHNSAGITVYGFILDRTRLHAIVAFQLSLTLWILNKTIGIS